MTPFSPKPQTSSSTKPCACSERIRLDGLEMIPDLTGALFVPDYSAVLVADLHFEKGSSRAHRGVHLPPYDTRSSLAALKTVLATYKPDRLISLGDSFHDQRAPDRLAADDLAAIRRLSDEMDVTWITGNHDPALPQTLGGAVMDEVALGAVTLRHIPQPCAQDEIAGHLHPTGIVIQRGRRLRRKCFASDGTRLIMPAFGAYTGGLNVKSAAFGGLFAAAKFSVWMLGRKAIHKVGSRSLLGE
ncbi:MAG: ligase-associated DNA damage response endonuclease PdeM [Rhizobiales bacterium]|nr:ligase-associated DNA damage response endonuclease PdeM [Hyphomicrobiales bacterium]